MLLLESNAQERQRLVDAVQHAGYSVRGAGSIAEVERWPSGDVVITTADRYTTWWHEMGASHVIVLADSQAQGQDAMDKGAHSWLLKPCRPEQLIDALRSVVEKKRA